MTEEPGRPHRRGPLPDPASVSEFERAAADQTGGNIVGEMWYFLSNNKKWWLLPILMILLLFGGLTLLSGSVAAPFIYALF